MDLEKIVKAYVRIRDERTKNKQLFTEGDMMLKEGQEKLEAVLLGHLIEVGADSIKTGSGTFYKQEELKPSCQDWTSLYAWIKENDAFEALEKRVTKTFVKEYLDANDGALPPGISVYRENVVRVRRT